MAGLTIGSGIQDFRVQHAAHRSQKQFAEFNQNIASQDAIAQYESLARREIQERTAAAESLAETRRAAAQAHGTLRAAAGGTGGASVAALLDDFTAQEAGHRVAVKRNLEFRAEELEASREAVHRGHHSRLAANQPPPAPDFLGAALRIGLGGASSYLAAGGEF